MPNSEQLTELNRKFDNLSVFLLGKTINGTEYRVDEEGGWCGRRGKEIHDLLEFKADMQKLMAKWTGIIIVLSALTQLAGWLLGMKFGR